MTPSSTLDEPLPTDPAAGSTITIGWSLDLRQDDGTTLPFCAEGVFVRFTPPTGAPPSTFPARQDREGHFTATRHGARGRARRGRVRDARARHVFAGGSASVSSIEFFRVADTTAAEAAAAAALAQDPGRPCPGAPVSGARRRWPRRAVAPVADPAATPDHADSSRPGAADGSLPSTSPGWPRSWSSVSR